MGVMYAMAAILAPGFCDKRGRRRGRALWAEQLENVL